MEEEIRKIMMVIPNIIDPSVRSEKTTVRMWSWNALAIRWFRILNSISYGNHGIFRRNRPGQRKGGCRKRILLSDGRYCETAFRNLAYARDFMIDRGFTYCVPPFMIHGNVVNGVMSFAEMESMMYKFEGEDLYLIGTSEHSMIGKFIDSIIPEEKLPLTLTSYSPCFRKEKGAHGIEERGVYRIHQFENRNGSIM